MSARNQPRASSSLEAVLLDCMLALHVEERLRELSLLLLKNRLIVVLHRHELQEQGAIRGRGIIVLKWNFERWHRHVIFFQRGQSSGLVGASFRLNQARSGGRKFVTFLRLCGFGPAKLQRVLI